MVEALKPPTLTAAVLLFAAAGLAACAHNPGPPVPKGWAANEETRRDALNAGRRVVRAEFRFYSEVHGPRTYIELSPARVVKLVQSLVASRRRGYLPVDAFSATAVFDAVELLGQSGERLATVRVPGDPADWHGPDFARIYADAKKKAR